jgi:hypothetical protein
VKCRDVRRLGRRGQFGAFGVRSGRENIACRPVDFHAAGIDRLLPDWAAVGGHHGHLAGLPSHQHRSADQRGQYDSQGAGEQYQAAGVRIYTPA